MVYISKKANKFS